MVNFEAFLYSIKLSANLLFMRSVQVTKILLYLFQVILYDINFFQFKESSFLFCCTFFQYRPYYLTMAITSVILREDVRGTVRGVAGVALATPFFQDLFYLPSF